MQTVWPIINGQPYHTSSAKTAYSPIDRRELAQVGICTAEDVDAAVGNAKESFQSWGRSPKTQRAEALNAIADILIRDLDTLALNETMDTGKCLPESKMQLQNCADIYRYFAAATLTQEDTLVQHPNGSFSAVVREPLGVVGLILPWNAPSMLMTWKLAPALASGCCAVIKPASNASIAVLELARRFQEVLPPGVLNVVTGPGATTGQALIHHPMIDKLSFTGSTEVGRDIGSTAGNQIIPCTLELGGKSPNILFDDANLERFVQMAVIGSLSTAGEICVAGSRLLVQETVYDKVVDMMKDRFEAFHVGDPLLPETDMGPLIDETQFNKVMTCIERGKSDGARLVCGGYRVHGGVCDKGYYVAPTLFADVNNQMWIARNEIFGPVLCVIPYKDESEAIRIANDSDYGLGAAVWTRDIPRAIRVSRALEAGTVWVNDYLDSSFGNPFGGYKQSGFGREIHKMAIENYTHVKNICVSSLD